MTAHTIDTAEGFMLAAIRDTNRRAYYTARWSEKSWWIPYTRNDAGVWERGDRGPIRIRPTVYPTVDDARRALGRVIRDHTAKFAGRVRIIDCATSAPVELEQVAAS